jgi:hypothetical protein
MPALKNNLAEGEKLQPDILWVHEHCPLLSTRNRTQARRFAQAAHNSWIVEANKLILQQGGI